MNTAVPKKKQLVFSGNTAWGMYNFRGPLMQYFREKGYRVTVIVPPDEIYEQELRNKGLDVLRLKMEAKGINPLKDLILLFRYGKLLKKLSPSYCFFYTIKPNIYGSVAAGLLGYPHIAVVTGLGYTFITNNIVSKIAKLLYKTAFRKSGQVWFLNRDDAEIFRTKRLIAAEKIHIIAGEGLDMTKYPEHILKPLPSRKSFLLIGRLLYDKGIGEYVDAAKRLKPKYPEVEFKLLGARKCPNPSAIPEETVNSWIKNRYISYLGTTSDIRPYINDSTCVVLPSYREGVPFTLLEASAMQRPIIASDAVGCREVIRDGENGFACKVGDTESLIEAMEKIIKLSDNQIREMGRNGRNMVSTEFCLEKIICEYERIIDSNA